jgi:cell division septation protein DedD
VFGSANSEASGRSTAQNIKAQLSDILIHRELDVTPRANGGFRIQAGPYKAKSSAVALCSAIRQRGIQCQVTP